MSWESFLSLQIVGIVWISQILVLLQTFICEATWPWVFFVVVVERILITFLIILIVIAPFIFSIFSWFYLGKLCISKNFSIFSRLSILLTYNCLQQSLMIFHISVVSVLFCIPNFFESSSFFFQISLSKGLSVLFIFSRNQLLV